MSTHTVLNAWHFTTANELLAALTQALVVADVEGHHPDTVYTGKRSLALVRSRLTDGSHVLNINITPER